MASKKINLALATAMLKDLDRLALKYGFDRTNTIRYCIRTVCDAELGNGADNQRPVTMRDREESN